MDKYTVFCDTFEGLQESTYALLFTKMIEQ